MLRKQSTLSNFQSLPLQEDHAILLMPTELQPICDTNSVFYIRYLGESMNPTFWDSDLLEVVPCKMEKIQIGDVIAFRTYYCEDYTIHRVIEVEGRGFKTRGDRNDSVDPFWVQPHHVVGKVLSLWRGQKQINVLSGKPGMIWAYFIHAIRALDQVISPKLHPLYRSLSINSRLLSKLLRPFEPQIKCFKGGGQVYYKIVIGDRVVGVYDNDLAKWRIRRPFRLVVDEERLVGIEKREA